MNSILEFRLNSSIEFIASVYTIGLKCHRLIYKVCFACFSNRVTIALNTFQGDEKNIVDRVARLVKMCGNRSRADEFIVILYGAAMFPKRSLSWRLDSPMYCFFAFFLIVN